MVELLAPGGSVSGIKAALFAGADAVYAGGPLFGARAYADNPEMDQLLSMIDYVHLRGKKLYLTVNTLLKENELQQSLYAYIEPLYRQGLDAVLVQDPGVIRFLRREFPELVMHASTQMSIHSISGASLLKQLGIGRIVPARELTLAEIRSIREAVDVEIECFVHGALCYCYSGRCLMSSMIGGRGGNRGRCAQPCRLPYTVSNKTACMLSLKDICTLRLLPDLIDAGIASFKIEGRMKRAEYAAGVSEIYRRYIDLYLQKGREGYHVAEEDERDLMDLYNRGGFSTGYYVRPKGPSMMAFDRPNHAGTPAAKVLGSEKGKGTNLRLLALEDLHKGDVIELIPGEEKVNKTLPFDVSDGQTFSLSHSKAIPKNTILPRVSNEQLLSRLAKQYCAQDEPLPVSMELSFLAGQSVRLQAESGDVVVCVNGGIPQQAQNAPLSEGDLGKAFRKTGGDGFVCNHLTIHMDEGLFMPVSALNALRRETLAKLKDAICQKYRREIPGKQADPDRQEVMPTQAAIGTGCAERTATSMKSLGAIPVQLVVSNPEQLREALSWGYAKEILFDSTWVLDHARESGTVPPSHDGQLTQTMTQALTKALTQAREQGISVGLLLPVVWRSEVRERFFDLFPDDLLRRFSAFALRCLDQLPDFTPRQTELIAEDDLYSWNTYACAMLREVGFSRLVTPAELHFRELKERGVSDRDILPVYGFHPLMITSSCLRKNTDHCTKQAGFLLMKDRTGRTVRAENHCGICTNILYNPNALDLGRQQKRIEALSPGMLRLHFTMEDIPAMQKVLSQMHIWKTQGGDVTLCPDGTSGHFRRGVE